jgi:hypothetical protein
MIIQKQLRRLSIRLHINYWVSLIKLAVHVGPKKILQLHNQGKHLMLHLCSLVLID